MDLFSDQQNDAVINLPVFDGEALLLESFLSVQEANHFFNSIKKNIQWRQESIKFYGKIYPVPRETAWYGDEGTNYTYSGISCNPLPWSDELVLLKRRIENLIPEESFNSVLLNRYRNGNDKVSWHSDNEKELGNNPVIASVSLGATRRFDLRHKIDKSKIIKIELRSGSLLIMKGALQHHWEHQIPQQKSINEERINLTFRNIKSAMNG